MGSGATKSEQAAASGTKSRAKKRADQGSQSSSRLDMSWLNLKFHDNQSRTIMTPLDLKPLMFNPPNSVDEHIFDKIHGSLIGLAMGDALGAHVEFRPHAYLQEHPVTNLQSGGTWGLKKGQFTDDTSMALCLAISLIINCDFNPYDQLVRYKWWHRHGYMSSTGLCFDIGSATKQALEEFERRQSEYAEKHGISLEDIDYYTNIGYNREINVKCGSKTAAGNGALMRLAPVPLFFSRRPQIGVKYSGKSCLLTHGSNKALDACRYFGALIIAALRGESKDDMLHSKFYERHIDWFDNQPLHSEIMKIMEGSYRKENGYDDGIRGKGYAPAALEAALWAFKTDNDSFETGVLKAVNLGDDADTTAAIYGQLAGAYYGYKALPQQWTKKIYAKDFISCLSKWIVYQSDNYFNDRPLVFAPSQQKKNTETVHDGKESKAITKTNENHS